MKWQVFRIIEGRGLVDYCGTVEAGSTGEAEDVARLLHTAGPGERIEVEPDEPESE